MPRKRKTAKGSLSDSHVEEDSSEVSEHNNNQHAHWQPDKKQKKKKKKNNKDVQQHGRSQHHGKAHLTPRVLVRLINTDPLLTNFRPGGGNRQDLALVTCTAIWGHIEGWKELGIDCYSSLMAADDASCAGVSSSSSNMRSLYGIGWSATLPPDVVVCTLAALCAPVLIDSATFSARTLTASIPFALLPGSRHDGETPFVVSIEEELKRIKEMTPEQRLAARARSRSQPLSLQIGGGREKSESKLRRNTCLNTDSTLDPTLLLPLSCRVRIRDEWCTDDTSSSQDEFALLYQKLLAGCSYGATVIVEQCQSDSVLNGLLLGRAYPTVRRVDLSRMNQKFKPLDDNTNGTAIGPTVSSSIITLPATLTEAKLWYCPHLKEIDFTPCSRLTTVELRDCPHIQEVDLSPCRQLTVLHEFATSQCLNLSLSLIHI